jgi:hypothetical protein
VATYTVYQPDLTGDSKAYVTPASGDVFPNDGKTVLHVKNANAGTCTVTINSQRPCDQGADHDIVVVVAATTGDEIIGPFLPSRFNDGSGNVVVTTYSVTASVSVAAIRVPNLA